MSTFLISVYFDEETNQLINRIIERIASAVHNDSMLGIPPHITVGMINAENVDSLLFAFKSIANNTQEFELQLANAGMFGSKVVFAQPVLSRELQGLCELVHDNFSNIVPMSSRYQPYGWIPHITLAKHLTSEQQIEVIKMLQNENLFQKIRVEKIGLASTKPYQDIVVHQLAPCH